MGALREAWSRPGGPGGCARQLLAAEAQHSSPPGLRKRFPACERGAD